MNEEKIERRVHWVQILATGLIVATAWCVRMQFQVNDLRSDVDRLVEKEVPEENRLTSMEKDIEWLKEIKNAH